jgi:putative two-component system response regulator
LQGVSHLQAALPYVRSHHEKWDGSGYPDGLQGEDIPREGRLLAVVDVFDALTSDRSYHKGMTLDDGLEAIRKGSGTHFDPAMVEVFLKIHAKQ